MTGFAEARVPLIDLAHFACYEGVARSDMAIFLRPMQLGDEAVFRDLYAEMRGPELQRVPWPDAAKRQFCDDQYGAQDAHYRTHYVQFLPLAVCLREGVIGRLYLGEFDGALILMDIIIAARLRGRGIGSMLVEAVTRHADACGVEARLHVEPHNPIRKLYLRLGFVETGEAGIYQQMARRPAETNKS